MDLLGWTIEDFIASGYLALVCLLTAKTGIGPEELEHASVEWFSMPSGLMDTIIRQHFAFTPEEHRAHDQFKKPDALRRFQPSPLYARPLVFLDGVYVAPAPMLVAHKLSPRGLLYVADELWNGARRHRFATDMGVLFERYVGSQLALTQPDRIEPEQVYNTGDKTVDWVVELDDLVILVEVKLFPANQTIRMGGDTAAAALTDRLGTALNQIARTHALIQTCSDVLPSISRLKRRVGLVVTLDGQPSTAANITRLSLPDPGLCWQLVSVEELEWLGSLPPELARDALRRSFDVEAPLNLRGALTAALNESAELANPILEAAMARTPLVRRISGRDEPA